MSLGSRVRAYRKEKQWTIRELADKADLSKTTVANIENDFNGTITVESLLKICSSLGISLFELLPIEYQTDMHSLTGKQIDAIELIRHLKEDELDHLMSFIRLMLDK